MQRLTKEPLRKETVRPGHGYSDTVYLSHLMNYLRRARCQSGMSVEILARRAGLRERVIEEAERNQYIPKTTQLKKWAAALGCSWEEIWTECCQKRGNGVRKRTT